MKNWYENYVDLMYRTRYVGIVVSAIFVLLAINEIWNTIDAIYKLESQVSPELAHNIRKIFFGDVLVGIVFALRGAALWNFKKLPYSVLMILLWVSLVAVFTDLYLDLPYNPNSRCTDGRVCFTLYDITSVVNKLNFAGILFILASFVRIAVTFIVALFRLKNNELNSYS